MDEKDLKQEIQTIDEQVNAVVIKDVETFNVAGAMTINLDALIKKIKTYWEDPIKKAYDAHKALTAKREEMLKPIENYRKILKNKISAYLTEQERLRQEEQRRIDEKRRADEQKERERLEKLATKAEEKGKTEKAEEWKEKAKEVYIPPTIVVPEIEKTTHMDTGTISQKKEIEITIIDPLKLIQAVAAGAVPISTIKIEEAKLKSFVKLQGLKELPGCEIREVMTASFRGNK